MILSFKGITHEFGGTINCSGKGVHFFPPACAKSAFRPFSIDAERVP